MEVTLVVIKSYTPWVDTVSKRNWKMRGSKKNYKSEKIQRKIIVKKQKYHEMRKGEQYLLLN